MRLSGTVVRWNDDKGFGFIESSSGSNDIFVHISAFPRNGKRPVNGMKVMFEPSRDKDGRPRAINVSTPEEKSTGGATVQIIVVLLFFAGLALFTFNGTLPVLPLFLFPFASVITFLVYAHDKAAAQKGAWRVSESGLHFLALIGGWPGGLLARHTLRHKTVKEPFRFIFWCTVVFNLIGLFLSQFEVVQKSVSSIIGG